MQKGIGVTWSSLSPTGFFCKQIYTEGVRQSLFGSFLSETILKKMRIISDFSPLFFLGILGFVDAVAFRG